MTKQDVYTDKGINEYLNENFISYMLDSIKLMDKI